MAIHLDILRCYYTQIFRKGWEGIGKIYQHDLGVYFLKSDHITIRYWGGTLGNDFLSRRANVIYEDNGQSWS